MECGTAGMGYAIYKAPASWKGSNIIRNKYIVIDITTGRGIGCLYAKSLRSAQCLAPRLFGYGRFDKTFAIA